MARSGLQERRRADNRQDILDAAREIVSRDGPGAMTLSAVAGRVGLTTPALYYYFRSKEELLHALVESWIAAEADSMVAACQAWSGDEAGVLGAVVRALYDYHRPNLSAFRLIYLHMQIAGPAGIGVDRALLDRIHPHSKRMFDAAQAVLERGQRRGTVAPELDPRTTAVATHSAAVGLLTMIALAERAADPLKQRDEQLLRALMALVEAGARPAPPGRS